MIKFFDIHSVNKDYQEAFHYAFDQFLNSGRYILGNELIRFEEAFAAYCGAKYCLGVGNGLDALTIIFESYIQLGKLNKGDEVLVPANTYIASILAIIRSGLKPVLIEPEARTYNIDVAKMKSAITNNTKAVLVVHLYGQLANVDEISALTKSNGLLLIEDAAQAHGAKNTDGKLAGNLGDAAAFSFYPAKNLGALGDGGAIVTNDDDLARTANKMRNYGTTSKYVNEIKGVNSRLDEIQAVFLNIKLKDLDKSNQKRVYIAKRYLGEIQSEKITLPYFSNSNDHVFHQFVIRVNDRENLMSYLEKNAVETLIHYPIAPHKQDALKEFSHLNLPVTERIHETVLSLPMYPTMMPEQVDRIIELLNTY